MKKKKKILAIKFKFGINSFKLNNFTILKIKQYNTKLRNIAQNVNNKDTAVQHILS